MSVEKFGMICLTIAFICAVSSCTIIQKTKYELMRDCVKSEKYECKG